MRVPFAIPATVVTWAVVSAFSIVLALVLAMLGALGHWSGGSSSPTTVSATVVTGVSCDQSGLERISYPTSDGKREASLDACGHQVGETVDVAVGGDTAHLAQATAGASFDARPFAVVLLVFAGIAGAGYLHLIRRR
ncbi:hypothetical protein [Actinokineospora inagensis]|uniref:hypothetical protein n=1 Tax=Actinokineospora inagensis TaxID=103730 RepID=UPI000423DD11|nr:hypothetical protein [Actinokineospora inagensis]